MNSSIGRHVLAGLGGLWRRVGGAAVDVMQASATPASQRNMVKLRLQRWGQHRLPFYRLVAADSRFKRDGRCLEYLGTYNPLANSRGEKLVTLNIARIKYWLVCGAQPTDKVADLLGNAEIIPAQLKYRWRVSEKEGKEEKA